MAASYEAWEAVTDEEQLEVPNGSHSAPSSQKMKTEGNNYPWRHDHERMMAEFWLNNPSFYDKSQEHYKNKDRKIQLIQELIQQNREEWEKIRTPLPTVNQVTRHLRNIRTRFGKLLKRKSVDPTFKFSHRDQFILDHYQFLRPHLQRSRTPAMHAKQGNIYCNLQHISQIPVHVRASSCRFCAVFLTSILLDAQAAQSL
uniref:MADF domain-containing protein n=1 Tax=Branchiostoma floridae TaxID=7739 RepID=C3YLB4_BRAFL|eukprot:XP_002602839.1 hypothetical protein BRAFLDRAFT_128933 [Branchiostoma floridae]